MKIDYQNLTKQSKVLSIPELTSILEKTIPIGFTSSIWTTFKPKGFFRARPHNNLFGCEINGEVKKFQHEGEFWNKPPEFVSEIGRCNDIKESYLYCSTDLPTAIIESKPKINEYVSVSSFELRNSAIFKGSRIKFIGQRYLCQIPSIKHLFTQADKNRVEEFKEIDLFFDSLFHVDVTEENKYLYKLSNAVTKCMMKNLYDGKNEQLIHGMMYSSIERDKKNYNLIYRPEHARCHFVHHEVLTYEVIDENNDEIILKHRRTGYTAGQKFNSFDNFPIIWIAGSEQVQKVLKNVHD